MTGGAGARGTRRTGTRSKAKGKKGKGAKKSRKRKSKGKMARTSAPKEGFVQCVECDDHVKEKNYESHLRRVHDLSEEEAEQVARKALGEDEEEDKGTARSESAKAVAMILALVLVIVIIFVSYQVYLRMGKGGGGGDGDKVYQTIHFETEDGWEIHGDYYPPAWYKPTVILVHGFNEDRKAYKDIAKELYDGGYGVFSYDSRGHGDSMNRNGTYIAQLSNEEVAKMTLDIKASMDYLASRGADYNGVVIMGASVGANTAMFYAVNDSRVKAVVLLSPGIDYRGTNPIDAVRDYRGSILFVTNTGDSIAYRSCLIFFDNATNAKVRDHYYEEGYLHGTGTLLKSDMKARVLTWIDDNS
jgi:dienelactone hydrolase